MFFNEQPPLREGNMGMLCLLRGSARPSSTAVLRLSAAALFGLCCLALSPSHSAIAAPRTVGEFSIELPAGWKAAEEGNSLVINSPKEDCYITVLEKDYYEGDLDLLAKASASVTNGSDLRTLGDGKGVVFADRGALPDRYGCGRGCRPGRDRTDRQ